MRPTPGLSAWLRGAQLQALFAQDPSASHVVALAQWPHRPLVQGLKERVASFWEYWL